MSGRSEKIKRERKQNWKVRVGEIVDKDFGIVDYIVMAALFLLCFFCFMQGDIMVTGNRSFLMHTNLLDFYDACYEWTQDYGANYLPSTFLLFAVWNLPLRLFGRVPADVMTNAAFNNLWYKLLPVLFYFASAILIYKICMLVGFGERKAKICKYAFLLCPLAVFSQMIYGQYDIFTVFFILLGFYYYMQNKEIRYILFFGIAVTFKYQALIYFLVFLCLKEKRVFRLLRNIVLVVLPTAIEMMLYYPSGNFQKSVLGFGALSYLETGIDLGGERPINLLLAAILLLLIASYIVRIDDSQSHLLFRWCIFFANGVSFAFFGFSFFHPQWILITVPFLVMGIIDNKNSKFLLLLQNIYIIAFYVMVTNIWPGNVDQQMFLYSPLKRYGTPMWAVTMKEIYMYDNLNYLFTCIWVLLLVYFVMSHPRFAQKEITGVGQDTVLNIRIPFAVGVAAWVIPAFLCLYSAAQGKYLMVNTNSSSEYTQIPVLNTDSVSQVFYNSAAQVYDIELYLENYGRTNESTLFLEIRDETTNHLCYEREINLAEVTKNEDWFSVVDENVALEKDRNYRLVLKSDSDSGNCVAVCAVDTGDSAEKLVVNDQEQETSLVMRMKGCNNEKEGSK
jgi:hypothetical protein